MLEALPESPKGLETTIVRKFIGALQHFEGRHLEPPVANEPWPDFVTREGERQVGIEVVEVINPDHAQKRRTQQLYAAHVQELLDDALPQFAGLRIQLDDGYQDPPYPALSSAAGRALAESLAHNLREAEQTLQQLPVGRGRYLRWQAGPDVPNTGAIVTRQAPYESGIAVRIQYLGSFPESQDFQERRLVATIEGKIDKQYTRYAAGPLLLLAYGQDVPVADTEVDQARAGLRSGSHRFDEVWYFFPYAGEDLGHIVRIWP